MSSFIQNTIILGGVIALIALGYFMYTQDSKNENSSVSRQVAAQSEEFIRLLNELQAIELDGSIFSDPRFISLVNYSTPVLSEPVGNPDPFDLGTN